jgi:hypothetical protein
MTQRRMAEGRVDQVPKRAIGADEETAAAGGTVHAEAALDESASHEQRGQGISRHEQAGHEQAAGPDDGGEELVRPAPARRDPEQRHADQPGRPPQDPAGQHEQDGGVFHPARLGTWCVAVDGPDELGRIAESRHRLARAAPVLAVGCQCVGESATGLRDHPLAPVTRQLPSGPADPGEIAGDDRVVVGHLSRITVHMPTIPTSAARRQVPFHDREGY